MLGQWVAPVLFEARQLLTGLAGNTCGGPAWGTIILCILLAFICGCCCGGFLSLVALSSNCRRLLHGLARLILTELWVVPTAHLTAEQRLADEEGSDLESLTIAFGGLDITIRRRTSRAAPSTDEEFVVVEAEPAEERAATDDEVLAAITAEALGRLHLPELDPLARRLTGAGGEWSGAARVARAYRAGVGAKRFLAGDGSKIWSPQTSGLRNVYYVVLRAPNHPDGFWTRSFSIYSEAVQARYGPKGSFDKESASHAFATQAEAMAGTAAVRRPLGRAGVEAQVATVHPDRPLPPAYLVLAGAGEGDRDDFAVAFLLRVRANGFMFAVPDVPRVREYVEGLTNEEDEPLVLSHREQVQAETVRGRHLGPAHVLLLDMPWAGVEHLVSTQALRGLADRAARVVTLTVGTTPARPCAADTVDAAARWVDRLDPDTAQEYWATAQEIDPLDLDGEGLTDGPEPPAPAVRPPPAARTLPAAARASQAAPPTGTGALFGQGPGLTEAELVRLRALAGTAPPRTGAVERQPPAGAGALEDDLQAEAGLEALPPADVEDPALEAQNALLISNLAANRSADGIQDALAGSDSASASDASGGIKGHLARAAFVKQVSDAKTAAARIEANALAELGLTQAEPGLMRSYVEQRMPLNDHRTLHHIAALASYGWETGFKSQNQELMAFAGRVLMFTEQAALDGGKLQIGYLLSGYPDPNPLSLTTRRAPGLRSFSRLACPQWVAANLAYMKDLDYAETRIAQLGGRPSQAPKGTGKGADAEEEAEKPRRPPRRPKNADASGDGLAAPEAAVAFDDAGCARVGDPISQAQQRVLDQLELQLDHLFRVPAFAADDLGRVDWSEAVGIFSVAKSATHDRTLAPGCLLTLLSLEPQTALRFGADDLSDYYYTFQISEKRAVRNSLRCAFQPEELVHFEAAKGCNLEGPQVLSLNTMAMGDSLAVEVGQAAHFQVLRQHVGSLLPSETLLYRCAVPKSDTIELLAIDDHVCLQKLPLDRISGAPFLRDSAILESSSVAYKHVGLVANDSKKRRNLTEGVVLGAELDGVRGLVGPPRDRVVSLAALSMVIAKRGHATRELLEKVTGCWVHALMFRRPVFAVLDQLFREGKEHARNKVFRMSGQARNELQMLACLCSTLVTDLRAQPDPALYCLDASPYAGAVCSAALGSAATAELWRHGEMRGYHTRLESSVSALLSEKGIEHEGDKLFGASSTVPAEFQHVVREWHFAGPWGDLRSLSSGRASETALCSDKARATARRAAMVLTVAARCGQFVSAEQPAGCRGFSLECYRTLVRLGCVVTATCFCSFGSPYKRGFEVLHNKPWLCTLRRCCTCGSGSHWGGSGTFGVEELAAFHRRCKPSLERVYHRAPDLGESFASFGTVLPVGLATRIGAGSAACSRGFVPGLPLAVRHQTAHRFGVDVGLQLLDGCRNEPCFPERPWHEDPEWVSELCRSLRFRELFRYPFKKAGHINVNDNVADPPSRGRDVRPPSVAEPRWLQELKAGRLESFEAVAAASRIAKNPARWLRFLLLLAGDIERNPGPLEPSRRARGPLDLDAGFAASTAHKMAKSFRGFLLWLATTANLDSAKVFRCAESTALALRGYGLHLFQEGYPRYLFVYAITAVQDKFPQHRNFLTAAWQIDKKWQRAEPGSCRPVLPVAAVRAALSLALLWDWHRWACLLIIGFLAMLHPGELVLLTRRDLVFPEDTLGHTTSLFVHLRHPKTSRFARRQHGRIDDAAAIAYVYSVVHGLRMDDRIYPASLHSFRRQWDAVLSRLGLPVRAAAKGATPGVLRGSGATHFYMCTENIPLLAWRGRWARVKTLEYYLQEVAAQVLLSELDPSAREKIKLLDKAADSLLYFYMGATQE
ncbi:unnamed protein product [Symbiodinium sp. CCMP2592]|nr:unnamed protein product [Symbiodinium sp. CCMP2592]